ncbi:MAG TPA: aminoglycoside phosphotransferase family protein [Candidatus Nanoarchaeia archaeon]|nr:aminoglycoside phosphotransferase family protein [Candidatus Nanoarchaeia archaeon]
MTNEVGGILRQLGIKPAYVKRFKKGAINKTYDIQAQQNYVLRIYPRDFWKAKKEAYLYRLLGKKTDVPVPNVIKQGRNYLLMQKVEGKALSLSDRKLVKASGEMLAKIHSVKFSSFGWIIGRQIEPKFTTWEKFVKYDTEKKLGKIPGHLFLKREIKKIIFDNNHLLKIAEKPCLLHKDYHSSHILTHDGRINGIIDMEWAMSGHNELDLAKTFIWMFNGRPSLQNIFMKGYLKHGTVSKQFYERLALYRILTLLSAVSFSYECGNKKWCKVNLKQLKGELNEYHKTH